MSTGNRFFVSERHTSEAALYVMLIWNVTFPIINCFAFLTASVILRTIKHKEALQKAGMQVVEDTLAVLNGDWSRAHRVN